jgi:hypothetical protein
VVYTKGLTSSNVLSFDDVRKKSVNGLCDIIVIHNKKKEMYPKMWFTQKALPRVTSSPLLMSAKRALMAFVSDLASAFASLNRPGGGGGGGGGGPPEVAGFGPEQRKAKTNIGDSSNKQKKKKN